MKNKIRYFKNKDCDCLYSLELTRRNARRKFHWKHVLKCMEHIDNDDEVTHNFGPEEFPILLEVTKTEASIAKLAGLKK